MQPWQKDPLGVEKPQNTECSKSAVERLVSQPAPTTIRALNDMATICREALITVRMDPAWHTSLDEQTKNDVVKALRLIG
jgi:hypothetical protein